MNRFPRYQIRTFRGYDKATNLDDAMSKAKSMIQSIKQDGWCDEYWWARIIDVNEGFSKVVWLRGCNMYNQSHWLSLC